MQRGLQKLSMPWQHDFAILLPVLTRRIKKQAVGHRRMSRAVVPTKAEGRPLAGVRPRTGNRNSTVQLYSGTIFGAKKEF